GARPHARASGVRRARDAAEARALLERLRDLRQPGPVPAGAQLPGPAPAAARLRRDRTARTARCRRRVPAEPRRPPARRLRGAVLRLGGRVLRVLALSDPGRAAVAAAGGAGR